MFGRKLRNRQVSEPKQKKIIFMVDNKFIEFEELTGMGYMGNDEMLHKYALAAIEVDSRIQGYKIVEA